MPVCASLKKPDTVAATGNTLHTAALVHPICAERFHRHYSGGPALLVLNRRYTGTTTAWCVYESSTTHTREVCTCKHSTEHTCSQGCDEKKRKRHRKPHLKKKAQHNLKAKKDVGKDFSVPTKKRDCVYLIFT